MDGFMVSNVIKMLFLKMPNFLGSFSKRALIAPDLPINQQELQHSIYKLNILSGKIKYFLVTFC